MSKIFVDQVDPKTGTSLTLGTSGDTVNIPSGVTLANAGTMTGVPAPTSGVAASAIDSGTIATARLGSGTASSSTFLRGDQTYAAAGGENTPAFSAMLGFNQSQTLTDNVDTKITMNTEEFDTDNAFDTSTYRFTVPSGKAGKYFFYYWVYVYGGSDNDLRWVNCRLYKNGAANFSANENDFRTGYPRSTTVGASLVADCAVGDYFEVYVQAYDFSGDPEAYGGQRATRFGGYKLIT